MSFKVIDSYLKDLQFLLYLRVSCLNSPMVHPPAHRQRHQRREPEQVADGEARRMVLEPKSQGDERKADDGKISSEFQQIKLSFTKTGSICCGHVSFSNSPEIGNSEKN